jgi:hypothetical protein
MKEPEPPTMDMLRRQRDAIATCARKYGAKSLRVFGSVASGDADHESDVDFLVALDRGRTYADIDDLEAALERLLGYRVDILTEGACHGRFAQIPERAVAL